MQLTHYLLNKAYFDLIYYEDPPSQKCLALGFFGSVSAQVPQTLPAQANSHSGLLHAPMATFPTAALLGLTRFVSVLRPTSGWLPQRSHHLTPVDDELFQRTNITLPEKDSPHIMYIDTYSPRGFTVNGNRVVGPCALVPHSVMQWNVGSHRDITEESFSLFWMLEPRIEIVVVGTGDRMEKLQPEILKTMRKRGLAVEVQDTPNVCATFNFLCNEGWVAGAALIRLPGCSPSALAPSSHVE